MLSQRSHELRSGCDDGRLRGTRPWTLPAISCSFLRLIHQYGTVAQVSSCIWQPTTLSIITPATEHLLWALLIYGGCGPAVSSTWSMKGGEGGKVLYHVHSCCYESWCINREKKNRGHLDLKQDEVRGNGHRQEGGYWPKLWKTTICRGV